MPHALFAVLVLLASFGLYLLFVGQVSGTELIAAGPTALACTGAALLSRMRHERSLCLPVPPMRAMLRVLASLFLDTARVGGVLLRSLVRRPAGMAGTLCRQNFHPASDQPRVQGRRALVVLGASLAPNGYVLQSAGGMLLHRLAPAAPSDDPEWPV